MFQCKVCNAPYPTESAANYCATGPAERPIYKPDESVKAHSYTMHEETSGWRNATVVTSYVEPVLHHTMYN